MTFAVSLDPNDKINSSSVLPQWDQWTDSHTELVFNVTETGQTNLSTITTDEAVLDRCRYEPLLYLYNVTSDSAIQAFGLVSAILRLSNA
jgi:hypothetical protein